MGLLAQWLASRDPMTLWVQALSAQGTATRGSLKWRAARTAPRVLFCMPTCDSKDKHHELQIDFWHGRQHRSIKGGDAVMPAKQA
jgi:hypothetical protein